MKKKLARTKRISKKPVSLAPLSLPQQHMIKRYFASKMSSTLKEVGALLSTKTTRDLSSLDSGIKKYCDNLISEINSAIMWQIAKEKLCKSKK